MPRFRGLTIKLYLMRDQNVLGIDVAKENLVIFDSGRNKIINVANTEKAIKKAIKSYGWDKGNYLAAMESTGDYSFLPMQIFVRAGFQVKLLNPIVTKKFIKATIRGKKTDVSDAKIIASIAREEGQIITEKELDVTKKTLMRLENNLTHVRSNLKKMRNSLESKAENGVRLKGAIKEVDSLIRNLEKAGKSIWKLSQEEEGDRQEEIISSHIGCGEKLSSIISAEAGDIKRFPSAKQFKAYAGIDPRVYQSGKKTVMGKMTKRGNSFLRQALFLAAFTASIHDPELKIYYQKKRGEGKVHTHALCTVARKLCERIYATVTQDRLYEPRYPQGGKT